MVQLRKFHARASLSLARVLFLPAQCIDGAIEQHRWLNWLDQNVDEGVVLGLLQNFFAAVGRHHYQLRPTHDVRQRANSFAGLDTVHTWHLPINKGNVVWLAKLVGAAHHLYTFQSRGSFVHNKTHSAE